MTFEKGALTDAKEVTVSAEINREKWPSGREAATPMLQVVAPNLQATARLHTWFADTEQHQTLEIMCYDDERKIWESRQSCSISESRYIELDVEDSRRILVVLKMEFPASYIMRPIVYSSQCDFVVALLRDTKLEIQKFQQEMETSLTAEHAVKTLSPIECKKDDKISTSISCVKPSKGFKFFPDSMCIHSVSHILRSSTTAYRLYHLTSDRQSTSGGASEIITIEIVLKRNDVSLQKDCFGFFWNGNNKGEA